MKSSPLPAAALATFSLFAVYPAYAAPSFCTGTTTTVASGDFVAGSFLVNIGPGTSTGNCVEAGDKVFGAFSVGNLITGGGSAGWLFQMTPSNVTIGLQGNVGPSSTGFVDYTVAVDPALSQGFLIDDLEKDFTFNASNTALPASATLTGFTNPTSIAFSCTRTVTTSTCPETAVFSSTAQLAVNETITTDPNAVVTALTDTISQTGVPEPGSLALLGTGLAGLALLRRHRRHGFAAAS